MSGDILWEETKGEQSQGSKNLRERGGEVQRADGDSGEQ